MACKDPECEQCRRLRLGVGDHVRRSRQRRLLDQRQELIAWLVENTELEESDLHRRNVIQLKQLRIESESPKDSSAL